jgi:hypothetical protein
MNKNEEKRRKREKTSRSISIRDGAGDDAPSTISASSLSRESSSREPPSNNATTTTTPTTPPTTNDKLQDATMKSTTTAASSSSFSNTTMSTGSNKDVEQRKQEQRLPRKKQARKEETTTKTRTSSSNNESRQQHARTIMAAMTVSTTRESNNEEEQRFHQPNRNATTKRRKNKDTNDLKDYCKAKKKNHHHGNERCAGGLSMESSALRSQRRAIRNAKQGQVSSTKEPTTSSTSSTRTTTTTTTIGEMHNNQAHSPNRINHATTRTRTMESREIRLNRSTMTTTKSRRKRRTSDDELTGAFQVSGRAIGALPAWARHSNEQGESSSSSYDDDDDDDNVPPEMRMVRHTSSSNHREEQQHASSFSPRDAQFDMPFQEQVPSITTDDEQFMLPAQVRSGPSSSRYPEPKVLDETRATKIWFMVAVSVLVATGIAVGVSVGLASKRNNDNASANECDFSSQEQPHVFLQCQCMGDIAIYSERTMNRYQVLLDTVMPLVNPDFNQHVSSCTPDNLALAWLATDEYSIMETNQEVLINRYVLAFLFQVWSGPSWKDNLGWLSPTPECDWYGISCEENAIVGLELGGNSLASTTDDDNGLPSELFTLTSLSKCRCDS